jgi:hypothetical protein
VAHATYAPSSGGPLIGIFSFVIDVPDLDKSFHLSINVLKWVLFIGQDLEPDLPLPCCIPPAGVTIGFVPVLETNALFRVNEPVLSIDDIIYSKAFTISSVTRYKRYSSRRIDFG